MASMGEGCNIHTDIAAAFSQKGNHHIVVYKGLETALKDPRKNYKDKVGALLRTWEQISAIIPRTNYASYEAKTTFKLMTWTFPRTLRLVLKQEWFSLPKIMKTHLIVTLQRCIDITTRYCQWDHKCELCTMLLGVVKNPWNILMYKEVASPEFLKWCKAEQDLILPLRFEMLIEDGLMDEAINLAEKIFQCLTSNGYTIWGDDSRDFFKSLDLYIFMLYRLGRERDIIDVLRKVPLRGALVVIRRFASKASQPTDTWKEVQQVAELTVSYFLAQAMLQPLGKIGTVLEALMEQWVLIYRNQPESDFRALVRKITQVADGAEQLYLLSRVIKEKLGDEQRVLNIELYIRGITTDMNALEQYKDKEDKEKELETEVRLSEAFLELSEFFKHVIGVRRECVLTAFCLNPTESCFTLIQNIAKESGKISQRNKCDHNFPQSTSNSGAAGELCPQCGQFTGTLLSDRMDRRACTVDALFLLTGKRVTESLNYDVLNAPSQVLDAANLGLSPEICSDLSVVLSSPRYRVLNWVMEWEEMNRICMEYMTNKEEMRCRVRVLNYLKIDYSQYKNWPNSDEEKDEFYGIEKGYEHMLELSNESSVDDCDSENNLQFSDSSFRHGRSRGIRDDSSGSDYSPTPRKKDKSKKKRSRTKSLSLSDLDTGAHDSDGCKREKYTKNDKNDRNAIKSSTRRKNTQKTKNIIVNEDTESINVSPFHAIINEDPEKLKSISPQAMLNEQRNIMNTEEDLKKIGPISPSQTYRKPPPKPFCKQPPQPICSITEESFRKFGPISVEQFYEPYEPDLCVPTEEEDLKKIVVKCSPPRIFSDPKESKRMPRVKKYPEKVYPKNHPQLEKPNFKRNKKQPLKPKIKEVVSDPKVVKSLRDFRPNSKKNIKVQDTSNADDKALYGLSSDQRRNLPYDLDGKNNISLSLPLPRVKSHDCIKYRLNIPGLNTLDMIKPPPSETTVQVVQFPRNTNTPSTSNNPSGNSHHPPKTTHSQNILSSGNSSSGTVGQEHETGSNPSNVPAQPVAPALTSSTAETQTQGTITTAQASNTPVSEQTKPVKLNSQSEVKYLTTTSEVNEILRSTLGEGNLHVYTAPQPPTSMGHSKQNVNSRPEVKCLTSSSEVPEILRSTLTEGVHQVQAVSSASSSHHTTSVPDFAAQSRAKLSTRSDVRYLAPVGGVNEILRTAPIVQKAHSSTAAVTSSLSAGPSVINASLQTNHSRQVNPVNPYPPIVKGVDLKVIANLLNKKAELAARDSQMLQLVCKGRKYQIKPLLCTQTGPRSIAAEHSGASTSITAVPVSSEQQQVIQQTPQQQQQQQQQQHVNQLTSQQQTLQQEPQQEYTPAPSVFEEDFTGFSASVGSSNDDKNSSGQNQKQEMSQIASLPKFQQAFGKTIYNSQASSSGDSGSHSATEESGSPESVDTGSQPSASTVLSKAVQTTNLGSGIPVSHTSTPVPQSEASTSVDISASTLHLASTGSVLSIVGAPRFSVATAVRVAGTGMTVQAIQTSTGVIYMHPETTTLVNATTGAAIPSKKKQMASSFDINPAKRKSQSSESVQQTQLPENSVAVAIATPFMPVLSRETAKRSRMLAAALQSPQRSGSLTSTASQDTSTSSLQDPEVCIVESSSDEETTNLMQQTTLTAVPKAVARQVVSTGRQQRPVLHIAGTGNIIPRPANSNIIQSLIHQTVQSVLISPGPSSSSSSVQPRMSQNVGTSDTLIPRPIDPSVSSTTLEQLREFESVLEQVTNTSQMKERNTAQPQTQQQQSRQQHTVLCQQLLITQASTSTTSTAMEFTSCTTGTQSPSFSQDLFPVATTTSATSRVNVTYVSQGSAVRTTNIVPAASVAGKITSPVVVVTSYCQPVASPALSVTSQSSSSPCVTPAPAASSAASAKSPPKSSKSSKSKSVKSSTATTTSKASPVPKPQQKPQEDEQTAQRIYAILGEYAEQLRNSPDLNNKPAPRRRSHPPTNSTQSAKRKKASHTKVKLLGQQSSSSAQEMSPGTDDHRTMGSEDSSSGITQLSHIQDSPGPSSLTPDEHLSLRATPSLDLGTEAGNLRSVVSDSIDMRDVSRQDQSQDQNSHSHEAEQSESQQSPLQLQQTAQHGLLFTEGRTVIVQDNVPSSVDANVTGSATVVTGKPVMVGNSTAVPALFAGVRQVIVPVGHGLTASVQARPVVVANSKGSKVIRVHQVTVPGGSLQMAPGTMQGAALVVRQINKPGIPMGTVTTPVTVSGMPTVKQVKLPVGSISSQALTGVTAQPPVVLPPGSHHLAGQVGSVVTSTIAQALAFPESAIESVLQEGTVRTESSNVTTSGERLLLNTATASQTINFIRRGIQTSFHERISTSGTSTVSTNTPASVSGTVSVNRLTDQTVRQISTVSTDSEVSTSSSTKTECSGISITKSNASIKTEEVKTKDCAKTPNLSTSCQSFQSQLVEASSAAEQSIDTTVFETTGTSAGCTNTLMDYLHSHQIDRSHQSDGGSSSTGTDNENQNSPWRFETQQAGSSRQIPDRDVAEIENLQERRSFLSDARTKTTNALNDTPNKEESDKTSVRIERLIKFKSLSEECEDLGVDEPSTRELFPEADLLLDQNSSRSGGDNISAIEDTTMVTIPSPVSPSGDTGETSDDQPSLTVDKITYTYGKRPCGDASRAAKRAQLNRARGATTPTPESTTLCRKRTASECEVLLENNEQDMSKPKRRKLTPSSLLPSPEVEDIECSHKTPTRASRRRGNKKNCTCCATPTSGKKQPEKKKALKRLVPSDGSSQMKKRNF